MCKKKSGEQIPSNAGFKCFFGNDVESQYWYECLTCGCVVIVDHSKPNTQTSWDCPQCNKLEHFPFRFFTTDEVGECSVIAQLIDIHKKDGFGDEE